MSRGQRPARARRRRPLACPPSWWRRVYGL